MHPIVWLALLGGAFFLGRSTAKPADKNPSGPTPPLPSLPPPPESAGAPTYAPLWEAVDYVVDIFPPEAEPSIESLLPPPARNSLLVAPGCRAIAVGEDWWDAAMKIAAINMYEQGRTASQAVSTIVSVAAPSCRGSSSPVVSAFRRELMARVSELEPSARRRNKDKEIETTVTR